MIRKLLHRLRVLYNAEEGWCWAALMIGAIIGARGFIVVVWGTEVLHPSFPDAAAKTMLSVETRSWFLMFVGAALIASILFRWRHLVRPAAMGAMFLSALVGLSYWLADPPGRLYLQGTTYLILAIASALVYTAAGDAKARGW